MVSSRKVDFSPNIRVADAANFIIFCENRANGRPFFVRVKVMSRRALLWGVRALAPDVFFLAGEIGPGTLEITLGLKAESAIYYRL